MFTFVYLDLLFQCVSDPFLRDGGVVNGFLVFLYVHALGTDGVLDELTDVVSDFLAGVFAEILDETLVV